MLQELAAQGRLPQGRSSGPHSRSGGVPEEPGICRDVFINDAPADMRHHLTKRPTQDDIGRRTGTQIVTRGRYLAPGAAPAGEADKPLHLHITPGASATEARLPSSARSARLVRSPPPVPRWRVMHAGRSGEAAHVRCRSSRGAGHPAGRAHPARRRVCCAA